MTSPQDMGGLPQPTEPQDGQGTIPAAGPQVPVSTARPRPGASAPAHHRLRRTRLGGVWVGLTVSAIVLLLLLVFILENGQEASIGYFGAHGRLPLGVALLLAAVAGALLVTIPASGRIIQLRRAAHRHRRIDTTRQSVPQGSAPPGDQPGQPGSHA